MIFHSITFLLFVSFIFDTTAAADAGCPFLQIVSGTFNRKAEANRNEKIRGKVLDPREFEIIPPTHNQIVILKNRRYRARVPYLKLANREKTEIRIDQIERSDGIMFSEILHAVRGVTKADRIHFDLREDLGSTRRFVNDLSQRLAVGNFHLIRRRTIPIELEPHKPEGNLVRLTFEYKIKN